MPDLSDTIQTMLNGRMIRVGHLVEFQFDSTVRLWDGARVIETSDGNEWYPLRHLSSIDGLEEEDDNLQASEVTMSISGVDPQLLQMAVAEERSTYIGHLLLTKLQFFNEHWQCQDDPIARNASIIDGIEITWSTNDDGSSTRVLSVKASNIFFGRGTPPASNYSDRDQQFRSPGDRGMQFTGEADIEIQVPW